MYFKRESISRLIGRRASEAYNDSQKKRAKERLKRVEPGSHKKKDEA